MKEVRVVREVRKMSCTEQENGGSMDQAPESELKLQLLTNSTAFRLPSTIAHAQTNQPKEVSKQVHECEAVEISGRVCWSQTTIHCAHLLEMSGGKPTGWRKVISSNSLVVH